MTKGMKGLRLVIEKSLGTDDCVLQKKAATMLSFSVVDRGS